MQVKKCFPAKFAARRVPNAPRSEGAGLRKAEESTSPAIANPPPRIHIYNMSAVGTDCREMIFRTEEYGILQNGNYSDAGQRELILHRHN